MLDISKIKKIIDKVIEKEGIDLTHLLNNGAVRYKNGNDGTSFDYGCNNMTCEFYVYWKSEAGAIKLNQRGDKFDVFVFPEEDPFGGKYHEYEFDSPFDLYELCCYLQGTFDDKGIYDKEINDWVLDTKGYVSDEDGYIDDEDEGW